MSCDLDHIVIIYMSHLMDALYYNPNSNGPVATEKNMFKYTDDSYELNDHLFWCTITLICPSKQLEDNISPAIIDLKQLYQFCCSYSPDQ